MSMKRRFLEPFPLFLIFTSLFAAGIVFGILVIPATGAGHKASHGGVLNVIGKEEGHAEIRLTDDLIEVWLVGGGNDTHRAVPIAADSIELTIEKKLVLDAAPLILGGESKGNCSHFEARAEWLPAIGEFIAHGEIRFKGREQKLLIHYPVGYHSHHDAEHEHRHEH